MNNNSENHQIIGFDLGHGKTALAQVISSNGSEPEIIEIQNERFQMTAITYDYQGLPIIGEAAFEHAKFYQKESQEVNEFEISFKQRPDYQNEQKNIINDFVQAVYSNLKESGKLQTSMQQHFFIGCPSGWNKEEQNQYKQLMSEAGLPNVVVVPESRAAFMHAMENQQLTNQEIKEGILVIDIGSSTTDFTFVFDNKPEDLGEHKYDLGASLIEKEILQTAIENHQNKEKIQKHFKINQLDNKIWEIEVRKNVKERYFKNYSLFSKSYSRYREMLQPNLELEVKVNQEIIEYIINKPLEKLGNISWKQRFYDRLSIIHAKFDKKGINPSKIILTGGGSRMNFIREICQEIFRCSPDLVVVGNEPELSVARGLARWGRLCINTSKFEEDINKFIRGELRNIVKQKSDKYLDRITNLLTDGLLDEVVTYSLREFREGKIKQKNIEYKIQERSQKWLQLNSVQEKIIEQLKRQVTAIKEEVEQEINKIYDKYGLPSNIFEIQSDNSINLALFENSNPIKIDVKNLRENSFPNAIKASLAFGSAAYFATVLVITDVALEAILAPITGGLSAILGAILTPFLSQLFIKKNLTDRKIQEITEKSKPELEKNIKQKLDKQPEQLLQQIMEITTNAIETAIKEKANDARVLLY